MDVSDRVITDEFAHSQPMRALQDWRVMAWIDVEPTRVALSVMHRDLIERVHQ